MRRRLNTSALHSSFFSNTSSLTVQNSHINNVASNQTINYNPNTWDGMLLSPGLHVLYNTIAGNAMHDGDHRGEDFKCHEDTRTVVIADTASWILDTDRLEDMLWVRGTVGVGKSTLAKTVADRFHDGKVEVLLAGSFFFFRDDPTRNHPGWFVATIAYRLAIALPDVGRSIEAAIARDPSVLTGQISHQWTELVVKPVRDLAKKRLPVVIIVDGLDE